MPQAVAPEQARSTINAWFQEKIVTGPIARNTDCYNQVFSALEDLCVRFGATPSTPQPQTPPATGDTGQPSQAAQDATARAGAKKPEAKAASVQD